MVDSRLLEEQYYHGLLPREDLKEMLRSNGDFLVRSTEPVAGRPRAFVLSVMTDQMKEEQGIKHYVIQRMNSGKYMIDWLTFPTISELIFHHMSTKESISKSNYVVLRAPIIRQQWELEHTEVEVTKKLGEGAFGEVSLGRLTRKGTREVVNVAIKLAKLESLTKEQVKEIMHEARLMRMFDHPNVIRIYGVAALQEPLMLVMELASDGSLDGYLRKHEVQVSVKNEMCAGASYGLEYLHSVCNVMHRDIAARNCLYGGGQVKISDFGLTQEGNSYQMDPSKRVPIRWLSPETLRTAMYSQKSDVFSYGVLCWEIYSNGVEPYPGMTVGEVGSKVKDGYRLPFPDAIPSEIVTMITQKCWADSQNDRYAMEDVSKFWERFLGVDQPKKKKKQPVIQPVQRLPSQPTPSAHHPPAVNQPAQVVQPANPVQPVQAQPMQVHPMQPMQAPQQVAPQFQSQPMQMQQVPAGQMVQGQPNQQQEMMSVPVMFNSQGQIVTFPGMMPQGASGMQQGTPGMQQGMSGMVAMQAPQGAIVAMQPVNLPGMVPANVLTIPMNENGGSSVGKSTGGGATKSVAASATSSQDTVSQKSANQSASVLSSPLVLSHKKSSGHKKKKSKEHKKKKGSGRKKSSSNRKHSKEHKKSEGHRKLSKEHKKKTHEK